MLLMTPGESLGSSINRFDSAALTPRRSTLFTAGGNIRAGGSVNFELMPEGWTTIFKHLLLGTPVTSGSVGTYTHVIKAGNTIQGGLSFEKRFNDINKYLRYWGGFVDSMTLNFPQEGYITGSANILAFGEISDDNAEALGSPYLYGRSYANGIGGIAPAATFPLDEPFVTYSGVVQEGNPLSDVADVRNVTLSISNSFEPDGFVIGNRYRKMTSPNRRSVTGSFQAFFTSMDYYNRFLDETRSGMRLYFARGTKSVEFYMPRIELQGESPKVASSGSLNITVPFRALYDTTEGTDLRVTFVNSESSI